ncbi:MAG TPA: pyridoxal phosphate-dependent aminotransferase family protein [Salinimicrobium sp.]|nr:pyridoxal phosphate-dependent aminotransferase family protein [Salinimicrobium sp.]
MSYFPKNLISKLNKRAVEGSLRNLEVKRNLIDFSSNDYLGFASSEEIFTAANDFLQSKKSLLNGATGSRLISGNYELYTEAEAFFSNVFNAENALIFNSGYDANLGFFSCVPQRADFVFYDELIHASIRDGISLSNAKAFKFRHNNLDDLKQKIEKVVGNSIDAEIYIVTESIFSMDGDEPNLRELANFCNQKNYRLIVDEAHATGVLGKNGLGMVQEFGLETHTFARIVTFGKSLGCHGAVILGSSELKKFLINFTRSFIYTTGLPPHSVATMIASAEFLISEKGKNEILALQKKIEFFKSQIKAHQLQQRFIESNSAIQSCVFSGNEKVGNAAQKLQQEGFAVKAILSPTVPKGEERLRFCLHSYNSEAEIEKLVKLLANFAL